MKQINFQKQMAPVHASDPADTLLVHSIFATIQGEGPHVGCPAIFLRLGGCNLQCPGCDTEYTDGAHKEFVADLVNQVQAERIFAEQKDRFLVITGGEPLRQNLVELIKHLALKGWTIQIETNGTAPFLGVDKLASFAREQVSVVVSPKAGKVHPTIWPFITAYKYVLDADHVDSNDGLPTSVLGMEHAPARPHRFFMGQIFVQLADEPGEWEGPDLGHFTHSKNKNNLDATIASAVKYGYRLCIQTHKVIGLA